MAQDNVISSGGVTSKGGGTDFSVTFEARLEPPLPPIKDIGGGTINNVNGMHRYFTDRVRHKYFGYTMLVETRSANTYLVKIQPLAVGPDKMKLDDPAGYTMLPPPLFPAPQNVHGGDTIAVDLFFNPATGQKIVEYIHFQDMKRMVYAAQGAARDFSVEDAEIHVMEPHITVNGMELPATKNFKGGITGASAWIYIPNHGRYVMSLVPHPDLGLQKAGEVRGSSLSMQVGGDTITMDCNGRIAPGNAPYNLYVFYDAGWLPKDANSRNSFLMGSADRIDMILHR
jgi:hypothetical protein